MEKQFNNYQKAKAAAMANPGSVLKLNSNGLGWVVVVSGLPPPPEPVQEEKPKTISPIKTGKRIDKNSPNNKPRKRKISKRLKNQENVKPKNPPAIKVKPKNPIIKNGERVCYLCGCVISVERVAAIPDVVSCIDCQSTQEETNDASMRRRINEGIGGGRGMNPKGFSNGDTNSYRPPNLSHFLLAVSKLKAVDAAQLT